MQVHKLWIGSLPAWPTDWKKDRMDRTELDAPVRIGPGRREWLTADWTDGSIDLGGEYSLVVRTLDLLSRGPGQVQALPEMPWDGFVFGGVALRSYMLCKLPSGQSTG